MMEWTLALLFGAAVLLLILSVIKSKQSSKGVEEQIDQFTISFLKELNQLQQKVQNVEIDTEIIAQKTGASKQRLLLREVIDLHRRGYSLESISEKFQLTETEIKNLLAPYIKSKDERSEVSNESTFNA
ncbi:hypothetical protein [Peribacillus huizhouensis]|uniref:Resolvase HTH domain-containing protein n=1 Tax=Peribacillus huizhouensis TaxID=1501239 RepID=A0ABR6CN43_9BACI|nr:hypothetical protein [Peribacillus huizhouensis]MBA9026098.1 hypothetical protein [Peribacillus huizhouensis]